MPVVKRYGPSQIDTTPLPGVRKTAADTALSLGAGFDEAKAQTADRVAAMAGTVAQTGIEKYRTLVQVKAEQDAQTRLLERDRQLADFENQTLYDPGSGAFANVKGADATTLLPRLTQAYDTFAGKLEQGLPPDEQVAFRKAYYRRREGFRQSVAEYADRELQTYQQQEATASLALSQQAATANADNLKRVNDELTRTKLLVAGMPGLGADARAELTAKAVSGIHEGVITNYLSRGLDQRAQAYYDATKDDILGDRRAPIEQSLQEGSLRGEAQRTSDQIIAAGGTLQQQLEKIKDLDPKLRDDVQQRLEHRALLDKQAEEDALKDTMRQAYDVVDRTGDPSRIPTPVWSQLPGATRSAIASYARQKAEGVPVQTDLPTYYGLLRQAMNDPSTFANVNLLTKRHVLGDTEFKQLAGLQASIVNGDRARADKDLAGFRTSAQVVDDSLRALGVDPNAKPDTDAGKAIPQLRRMVDERVTALEALTGKKPTSDDVQKVTDQLLSVQVTVPGSWWNLFTTGKSVSDTTKSILQTTIADVPAADRVQIEQALRARGRPVTDATVLNLYLEAKARERRQ